MLFQKTRRSSRTSTLLEYRGDFGAGTIPCRPSAGGTASCRDRQEGEPYQRDADAYHVPPRVPADHRELQTHGLKQTALTNANRTPFHTPCSAAQRARRVPPEQHRHTLQGRQEHVHPTAPCCMNGLVRLTDDIHVSNPSLINQRDKCGL